MFTWMETGWAFYENLQHYHDFYVALLFQNKDYGITKEIMEQSMVLLYPARISFNYEREIKSFSDKQKLREFCTTKPALQQILKDIL